MKITKQFLQQKSACTEGIDWVVKNCTNEEGVVVVKKLMEHQLDWANWLIVRIMERPQYLKYAIFSAEQVIEIFEKKYPNDKRPRLAIKAAKKVLENDNLDNRKAAAYADAAAYAAAYAAYVDAAAYADAYADASAASASAASASASADASAASASSASASAAASAAYAAYAYAAAYAAAAASKRKMQIKILKYGLSLLEQSSEGNG